LKADLTEEGLFTISDGTRQTVQGLDEPVDLTLYFSKQLGELAPRYAGYFERVRGLLEQYRDLSGGKIQVHYVDPKPFSDAEDRAVAAGLQGIRLNLEGDMGYFGLVGTNSTDNQSVIEFFSPDREKFLEYDLTKLVYSLSNPKKPVVGIISGIRMTGGMTPQGQQLQAWQVMEQIREFFDVYPLDENLKSIPDEVKTLMIVQPDKLTREAAYAIDQFALRGGRILAFVDPLAELGKASPYLTQNGERSEAFRKLLEAWGVAFDPKMVATDIAHARRVQFSGAPGVQPTITEHIGWLALMADNLDQRDVLSSGIERINVATPGHFAKKEGAAVKFTPILQTSAQSMEVKASEFGFGADPVRLLRNFRASGKPLVIAARLAGPVSSAFPDGPPEAEKKAQDKAAGESGNAAETSSKSNSEGRAKSAKAHVAKGEINAIIVADTDMLHDRFWVEASNFLGQTILIPNAHNATFVLNALDNLGGSSALLSLRGRGVEDRPFVLV
ncbi:MAG: ABC transporter, partial [Alphaproteobacteria bacterium]